LKKVNVEVQFVPQCPWVVTSLRTIRECVQEFEGIAELKEVDIWRHPELAKQPAIFKVYINGKELPNMLGYPNKQLIMEEIRKAAETKAEVAKVTIKPLTLENLEDEIDLCTKFHTNMTLPSEDRERALKTKKRWLREIMEQFNPCALLAYVGEEPYGFIEFLPCTIIKRLGFKSTMTGNTAVIICLLVRQKAWKRGIASKLVQACINDLKRRDFKRLEVKANKRGVWHPVGFYEKMGFKVERELDNESCLMVYDIKRK
jgi:ribosomal protein S18 acetylase RimI-like enzyme